MSRVLKAVIIANGLAMLLSLLLLFYMSYCYTAFVPASALHSLTAAGLQVFCPARRLLLEQHPPQVELIKFQSYQNMPSFTASTLIGHVSPPHSTPTGHVNPPQLSNSSSSPNSLEHHDHQQQQDLQVGSSQLHNSHDEEEQEKRFVPAGPNPLHNR